MNINMNMWREYLQKKRGTADVVGVRPVTSDCYPSKRSVSFSYLRKIALFACVGASVFYLSSAQSQSMTNVALNKTATQGSQYGAVSSYGPQKAIDGNYSTFNHTGRSSSANWLEIDLGGEYNIKEVLIHNRNCCGGNRVRDAYMEFKDRDGNVINARYIQGSLPVSSPHSSYFTVPVEGVASVRIDNGGDYLHLTEVEVMGFPQNDGEWSFCAKLGQTCHVPAESSVRYGNGSVFHEIQNVTNAIECGQTTFGFIRDGGKFCEYKVTRFGADPIVGKTSNAVVGLPNWYSVNYSKVSWDPVMIAQMQTQDGADSAEVRMRDLSRSGFKVVIEEDQSQDSEIAHTSEVVGYLGFPEGEIADSSGKVIGEAGKVTFAQGGGNYIWQMKSLLRKYVHPIIIMGINTYGEADPSVMQVNYIRNDYFYYRLAEWDYLDGYHETETVSYIVIEAGDYELASGERLSAGTLFANGSFDNEFFSSAGRDFMSPPVVITQQQSVSEHDKFTTRVQDITTQGFKLRLEEQEVSNGVHVNEEVGYIAVGPTDREYLWRHTTKHFPLSVTNMNVAELLFNLSPSGTVTSYAETHVINFNQESGASDGLFPHDEPFSRPQGTSNDNFVVQSKATISVEESGNYVFGVRSDDGFRLRINGQVIAEHVNTRGTAETLSQPFYMSADTNYSVDLRYYERAGGASLEFYMKGEDSGEYHLVHAGLNLAPDDVEPARVLPEISSDNDFNYNVLRTNDKLIYPGAGSTNYAAFDRRGNFRVYNSGYILWSSDTSERNQRKWKNSIHHAKQCDSNLTTRYGECGQGHELKIDALGIYITNEDGMVIWRPDIGDLSDTDTSQGYKLRFLTNGHLGLENNATGHIRWDTKQGYRPVRKATTALFTSFHPDAAWQVPHTPHSPGTVKLGDNNIEDYVVEEMKQQSILSYHPNEEKSDVLLCFDCSTSSSTKYKAELTRTGNLRIVSTNSSGSVLETHWITPPGVGHNFNEGRVYLSVTHNGLELYNRTGNVVWRPVNLPDGNYMLRLAKSSKPSPHLELWDMDANKIVWDTDPDSNLKRRKLWHTAMPKVIKDTVNNVASAGQHLVSSGYNIAKFGWQHLDDFIVNSTEWSDFTRLFDDVAHMRVHDAFADLVQLEKDAVDDAERAIYNVGKLMLMVENLTSPLNLINLRNSPVWHEVWSLVKDPKLLVEYVERLVDGLKEAKHKAEMVSEVLQNPSDLEGIFVGAINNALEGGRDHLEKMLLKPMSVLVPDSIVNEGSLQHGRKLLYTGHPEDASCDDALDPRFCRFLSERPGFGWDISTPEIVGNFVSPNKSEYKIFNSLGEGSSKKQLNHLQIRTTLVPVSHLMDVNDDGVKELVKLRMRVQTLQITAMMDFRAGTGSLAFFGPFSGHTWSFPILAYDKNGEKIDHAGKNVIYSAATGLIARGDLQLQALKEFFGNLSNRLNTDQSISELTSGTIVGVATGDLGDAAASAGAASAVVSESVAATSSMAQASSALATCISNPIRCGLSGVSSAMFRGMGTMFTVGAEIVGSPFAKSTGITLVGSTPMRFRYVYNRMSPMTRLLLHGVEATGIIMGPILLEAYGVGFAIDDVTKNPLSTFSIESMVGSTMADLIFWGVHSAYETQQGIPYSSTISGYIGGSIGITMSFNRKAVGSSITLGGSVRTPERGFRVGRKAPQGGALLTKTRLRVRYGISVASDGKGADPI